MGVVTVAGGARSNRTLPFLGFLLAAALLPIACLGDMRVHTGATLALWGAAHAVYLAASWIVVRGQGRTPIAVIIAVALAARVALIPTAPTLSEDLYRYLWDGRLVAAGVNPYLHAPDDPALARFHDDLLGRLNHASVPTIYPPAAQLLFGAIARMNASPWLFKTTLLAMEAALWIAALALLRRRRLPEERLLLFAWNPLVILESYGSGHLDLAAAAFLVPALALQESGRGAAGGVAYALASATKYTPLLLVPHFLRRRAWLLLAVAGAGTVALFVPFGVTPFQPHGGLAVYLAGWEFNGSAFPIVRAAGLSSEAARLLLAGAIAAAAVVIGLRAKSATGAALGVFTAYLIASPTVYPWYVVPLAALFPFHPLPALLVFSGLVALSYVPLPVYHATGAWTLPAWIPWVEYGGLAAVWLLGTAWTSIRSRNTSRDARA
jgi:hypothetical protein